MPRRVGTRLTTVAITSTRPRVLKAFSTLSTSTPTLRCNHLDSSESTESVGAHHHVVRHPGCNHLDSSESTESALQPMTLEKAISKLQSPRLVRELKVKTQNSPKLGLDKVAITSTRPRVLKDTISHDCWVMKACCNHLDSSESTERPM